MPGLLLIAHAPLASALKAVAEHTFPHCAAQLDVLDVTPDMSVEDVEKAARLLLLKAGHSEALILTDVFGATPCNAAQGLQSETVRLVTGVNVPMLWRSLCYVNEPLEALIGRALQGGAAGILLNEIPVNPSSET